MPIIFASVLCIFVRTKSRPYRNHGRLGLSKGEVKGEAVSEQHAGAIIRSYCCRDRILGIFMLYNCYTEDSDSTSSGCVSVLGVHIDWPSAKKGDKWSCPSKSIDLERERESGVDSSTLIHFTRPLVQSTLSRLFLLCRVYTPIVLYQHHTSIFCTSLYILTRPAIPVRNPGSKNSPTASISSNISQNMLHPPAVDPGRRI